MFLYHVRDEATLCVSKILGSNVNVDAFLEIGSFPVLMPREDAVWHVKWRGVCVKRPEMSLMPYDIFCWKKKIEQQILNDLKRDFKPNFIFMCRFLASNLHNHVVGHAIFQLCGGQLNDLATNWVAKISEFENATFNFKKSEETNNYEILCDLDTQFNYNFKRLVQAFDLLVGNGPELSPVFRRVMSETKTPTGPNLLMFALIRNLTGKEDLDRLEFGHIGKWHKYDATFHQFVLDTFEVTPTFNTRSSREAQDSMMIKSAVCAWAVLKHPCSPQHAGIRVNGTLLWMSEGREVGRGGGRYSNTQNYPNSLTNTHAYHAYNNANHTNSNGANHYRQIVATNQSRQEQEERERYSLEGIQFIVRKQQIASMFRYGFEFQFRDAQISRSKLGFS